MKHGEARYDLMPDEEVAALAHRGEYTATEALMTRYRSLVVLKARSYYVMGADHDDVIQEGMIGLYKAIRDYREDRLDTFRPFAELCVTRQIITAVKAAARHKHAPLNLCISLSADGYSDILEESVPTSIWQRSSTSFAGTAGSLMKMMKNHLSEFESRVLQCYASGSSYLEMSEQFHCEPKSIDNALQRAKRKLGRLEMVRAES